MEVEPRLKAWIICVCGCGEGRPQSKARRDGMHTRGCGCRACKSGKRYFDLDAVRGPYSENSHDRVPKGTGARANTVKVSPDGNRDTLAIANNDGAGAPPLDYWVIPTHPYPGSHYATFPPALVVKPVKAMSPEKVCRMCGEPSRRIMEATSDEDLRAARAAGRSVERLGMGPTGRQHIEPRTVVPTGDWTDCGHDDMRVGVVLDPFAGSGTTLAVATGHGRDAIGIDLDECNAELALERVGPMLLTVEHLNPEGVA